MKRDPYQSLLVIVTGFVVLSYVFPRGAVYWIAAATILGIAGLISGLLRRWILLVWEKMALVLGWVNSRILLSLVFFLFLVPLGFLYKLFKGDLLFVKKPPDGTAFVSRDHEYLPKDLENTW